VARLRWPSGADATRRRIVTAKTMAGTSVVIFSQNAWL
jgi:hypothetical protein